MIRKEIVSTGGGEQLPPSLVDQRRKAVKDEDYEKAARLRDEIALEVERLEKRVGFLTTSIEVAMADGNRRAAADEYMGEIGDLREQIKQLEWNPEDII